MKTLDVLNEVLEVEALIKRYRRIVTKGEDK